MPFSLFKEILCRLAGVILGLLGVFMLFRGTNAIMSKRRKYHNMFQCVSSSDEESRPLLSEQSSYLILIVSVLAMEVAVLWCFTLKTVRRLDGTADKPTSCLFF